MFEERLDEVQITHGDAAGCEQDIGLIKALLDAGLERLLGVAGDAEVDGFAADGLDGLHRSMARLLSRIWPGPSGSPGSTSSSPVDRTATLGRGKTGTSTMPAVGEQPDPRQGRDVLRRPERSDRSVRLYLSGARRRRT